MLLKNYAERRENGGDMKLSIKQRTVKKKKEGCGGDAAQGPQDALFFFFYESVDSSNKSFTLIDNYGGKREAVSVSAWIFSGLHIKAC